MEVSMKNITDKEALEKVKKIAEDAKTCMFTTSLDQLPLTTRPMATQEVDAEGNVWFFSHAKSDKNRELQKDNRAQLFYSDEGAVVYMSLYGRVEVMKDKAMTERLWNPFLKTWFNEGKDDPNITLLRFTPEQGYYWDTKHNRVVQWAKIAVGALTGKMMDDGVEGTIKV
jgi:general stress protein 26